MEYKSNINTESNHLTAQQGTPEWYEQRRGKFTASEIHRLISKKSELTQGAQTYISEVLAEILTGKCIDTYQSAAMLKGKELEPMARELYAFETGYELEECPFIEYNRYSGGSPDGIHRKLRKIAEIKCPEMAKHADYLTIRTDDDLPKEYRWQMAMNILVTGADSCDFISFNPDFGKRRFFKYTYQRNEADEKLLLECLGRAITELERRLVLVGWNGMG